MISKKYYAIARCSLLQTINYRASYITNVISQIIYLVFLYYLWRAIFSNQTKLGLFQWEDMKLFIVLTFILGANFFSEWRIADKILDGSISSDLVKPLRFDKMNLAQTSGIFVFELFVSVVISLIIVTCIFHVNFKADALVGVLFFLSLLNALFIKFCVIYIAGLTAFWTRSVTGVTWARMAITNLFSGALIPLSLFPEWFQTISEFLPFQSIVNTPLVILLGHVSERGSIVLILVQLLWAILLWNSGRFILSKGLKNLDINGG